MNPKISVILATNRINKDVFPYIQKCIDGLDDLQENTFTKEFKKLAEKRLDMVYFHFLEPTLRSLYRQTFKDFEVIISHRYPEDANELIDSWKGVMDIKLIKEKPSIWHNLGDQYHTVANNKNTGLINSKGELIYHIDDLSFFNENLLQEAWDLWKEEKYITGRTVRCITYDKNLEDTSNKIGPNKTRIIKNGWIGEIKPLTHTHEHPTIPMSMFWTCSASVSAEELLKINGYDEVWDGSLAGIDMDAGVRLSYTSRFKRVASENYLYEIDDPTPKNMVRDDVMFRKLIREIHVKANSWKPTKSQMNRYKNWHKHNIGELDQNWDKFIDVPTYDLERKFKWMN
jgi:hypothetical protein